MLPVPISLSLLEFGKCPLNCLLASSWRSIVFCFSTSTCICSMVRLLLTLSSKVSSKTTPSPWVAKKKLRYFVAGCLVYKPMSEMSLPPVPISSSKVGLFSKPRSTFVIFFMYYQQFERSYFRQLELFRAKLDSAAYTTNRAACPARCASCAGAAPSRWRF